MQNFACFSPDMVRSVVFAHVWGPTQPQLHQVEQVGHKHSRPQRARPAVAAAHPCCVLAASGDADHNTHAHCPARRHTALYGHLRRICATAEAVSPLSRSLPSPPSPSGGQCRATSSHTPALASYAVASWCVRWLRIEGRGTLGSHARAVAPARTTGRSRSPRRRASRPGIPAHTLGGALVS